MVSDSDLRPTLRKAELPPPDAAKVKSYKAYLTRLGKYVATQKCNSKGEISEKVLRQLLAVTERTEYLDAAWAKKVFKDKSLFSDAGDGFWKVESLHLDDLPGEPGKWQGERPGSDVVGDALMFAYTSISRRVPVNKLSYRDRFLMSSKWNAVHVDMMTSLEMLKVVRPESPLKDMQERAFVEALLDDDAVIQVIAFWLTNTAEITDVMRRLFAEVKGGEVVRDEEKRFWSASNDRYNTDIALGFVRESLLNRGLLGGKKR